MVRLIQFLLAVLTTTVRTRASLQLEIAALRHQLSLYQRTGQRPRIESADRLLWSVVAKLWSGWRAALFFVQPRTVATWQKRRFREYWRALSRSTGPGRPQIPRELIGLIRRMWKANPTWGSPKIVAELSKLGINVAKSTVEKFRPQRDKPPSPTWKTFSTSTSGISCRLISSLSRPRHFGCCLYSSFSPIIDGESSTSTSQNIPRRSGRRNSSSRHFRSILLRVI